MAGPYAGVGVLELGRGAAIAYAGKLFADLGAEVTRVIDPAHASRAENEPLALYLGTGKQVLPLDLNATAHRATLREKLQRYRVLLHAADDRAFEDWNLTPEDIARDFPEIVVVAVTPFGLDAEARYAPADDLTLQALGGVSIGIGSAGRAPLKLPGDQSALQAGLAAGIASASVLLARGGALIDVAAADVWASFYTGVEVALAHFGRHRKQRAGQRVCGQPYPRTIFRCSDGYFAIQCGESRHWQSFLRMIGRPELATHPLFANRFKANDEHGDACDALIEPWFASRTKAEILQQCLEHRIPGAPVYDIGEVSRHPHLEQRGYFVAAETPEGTLRLPGHPFKGLTSYAEKPQDRAPHARGSADITRPLRGVRVVDFGWVWAGAVPGHILADLGAEVIKIESASPLDYMRQGRPIVGTEKDPEQNPMFHNVNRGKLSLRIDLGRPEAREVLKELVAKSDIVIENFSPGVMGKFGLDYDALGAVRPGLIMCSMSAVGQAGPLRGIRTYATMIASLAGLDSVVGYEGERVLGSQSSYADPNASLHATFGILAALSRREQTGEGAYLDLSQWEAAVSVMGEQAARFAIENEVPSPCGTRHASEAPYGNYPTAGEDRWIAIAVADGRGWDALRRVLGEPHWMASATFSSSAARLANRTDLDARLASETRKYDNADLAARLTAAGVAAAPVLDAHGVAAEHRFAARGLFEHVKHPILGSVPVYRLPWHVNGSPIPVARRAPLLGEHNAYTLETVLGYTSERIGALQEAGVFRVSVSRGVIGFLHQARIVQITEEAWTEKESHSAR